MVATILREVPAYTAQFYVFEGLHRYLKHPSVPVNDTVATLVAGGLGGVACWVSSYPMDVVKSNIQADLKGKAWKSTPFLLDGGVLHCSRVLYQRNGIRGFWIGIVPCMVGVLPGNAVLFYVYRTCMDYMTKE